jgi:G3E family GTPase
MIHSFIITGFLGVGKSSMLTNTIKNHFTDKKIALIVNEFGEVGGSNILVLNKTDLVNDEELENAKRDMVLLKEKHNLKNTLTGQTVFNNYFLHTAEQGIVGKEVFEGAYQVDEMVDLAKGNFNSHEHGHDSIERKVVNISKDIMFNDIDVLLKTLPNNIYRAKGMVKVNDVPTPLIVNHSFGNTSFDELAEYEDDSVLVLIGENLDSDVQQLIEQFEFLTLVDYNASCDTDHDHDHHHHDHA